MIDDDIDISEICCGECGHSMFERRCTSLGCEDGYIDGYEEDPLWYDDGDLIRCSECRGRGFFRWCPNDACKTNLLPEVTK